jgi:molecular chaperone DnaJ
MSAGVDPRTDHYKVLGVDPKSSAEEIKKAYRKLAKQCHPDSTGGDKAKEVRFKEVTAAYDVLGDAKKRAEYDQLREAVRSGGAGFAGFPGGAGGFGGFPGATGGGGMWDLSDLFAQMFRGQGGAGAGPGNVHVRFTEGGFDDLRSGGADPFGVDDDPLRSRRRGRARPGHSHDAPQPPAEQKVQASDGSPLTQRGSNTHGDLRLSLDEAILGTVREVATLVGRASLKIPPGSSSGTKLRLRGRGAPGPGGQPGDHFVTIQIDVPRAESDEARALLVQFMQAANAVKGHKPGK